MTRADCIRKLKDEYAQQLQLDEQELRRRMEEIYARCPEIRRLREDNTSAALSTMRSILQLPTKEARESAAQVMRDRGIANNRRIRALLSELKLPEDALDMRYRCPICRDTGLVGDAPARFCDCFEARLRRMMFEDGSMAGTETQNFSTFDESFIPEGAQREQLIKFRDMCVTFADNFPHSRYTNIVMTGQSGLGKTFLLNCIYERVVSRGQPAIRITAFRMFEAMRQEHLSADSHCEAFESLLNVPLLLIDDLGSEPMMRNITTEYLFTLLNERMAANLPTVIASNLTPLQIVERYGERVKSRMFDRTRTAAFQFKGVDLRSIRKA